MSHKFTTLLVTGLMAISLTGCGNQTPVPYTPPAQNQPAPAPTPAATTTQTTVYAIKLNDNGASANSVQVGCGDSAIPVVITALAPYDPTNQVASINAALMALENTTATQFNGQGLENPITKSVVTVQSVDQVGTNYVVHMNGQFSFSGTCDVPRQRAQYEETIKKAMLTGNTFAMDYNGGGQTAWDDAFSSK